MNQLPCEKLHCELLKRLAEGVPVKDITLSEKEISKLGQELSRWFAEREISLSNALVILEFVKAAIWESIVRNQ